MACEVIRGPDGKLVAVLCGVRRSRHKCRSCGQTSMYQCDWKLSGPKKGKTCDAHICGSCAREVGPDKHLCPPHQRVWDAHILNPKNQQEKST